MKKQNKQLNDENEIYKQEIENKEKEKIREPSLMSQEEGDNNDQRLSKLKNENEKLKIIENKYNIMEKEYEEFKKENDALKKDNEFMKIQLDSLKKNNNNNPKPFTVSISKCENFQFLGAQHGNEEEEYEEVYFENGNIPPQFLQNQHMGEEGDYGEGEEEGGEEEQIDLNNLTDEQKQLLLQMQMQQNGEEEYIDENGEHYIINNGENEEDENGENYEEFDGQGNNENMEGVEYEEIEEEQILGNNEEKKENNNQNNNKGNKKDGDNGDNNGLDILGEQIDEMGL